MGIYILIPISTVITVIVVIFLFSTGLINLPIVIGILVGVAFGIYHYVLSLGKHVKRK